jgi:hypothetical protein
LKEPLYIRDVVCSPVSGQAVQKDAAIALPIDPRIQQHQDTSIFK